MVHKPLLAASVLTLLAPFIFKALTGPEKATQSYYYTQPKIQQVDPQIISAGEASDQGLGFVKRDFYDAPVNALQMTKPTPQVAAWYDY